MRLLALIPFLLAAIPLHGVEIWHEGIVNRVYDVDTVEVDGMPIRLHGIDGLELDEPGGREAAFFSASPIRK